VSPDRTENNLPGDILVVDDNSSNRKTLTDILTISGYQASAVSDGQSALRRVEEKCPELILLDYKMPGMTGIEVCSRLKTNPRTRDIPVIFLSAHGDIELKVEALEAGAVDYVIKPINPEEVLARIDSHLNTSRIQRKLADKSKELLKENEERKQIENELRESLSREQTLADIVRNAPIAIAFGYPDGRLGNCNRAFSKLTGYSFEELQKIDWNLTLTPIKWREMEAESLGQLSSVNPSIHYEKEYIHKDGEVVAIALAVTASYDSDGNLLHFVGFVSDIREKNKLQQQLFVNENLATIAGLAAGVAHEINTPLSGILQAHQLVEMGLSPDDAESKENAAQYNVDLSAVQQYLQRSELQFFMDGIRDSALKASVIIKSLLEFSRPHEGTFVLSNLEAIVEQTLLLAGSDYELKKKYGIANIRFIKEYSSDCPPVSCVVTEIEQVVLGLIKNSAQAFVQNNMQQQQVITLRTDWRNGFAIIEVEDNGPGMDEEAKKHAFDPFFTTKETGVGTGLGLSVSHAIVVDSHQGTISIESEPNKGAKFIVKLPLVHKS